ncbi:hypothetical protein QAD02_018100 [Eretmocerus hayati]|uniref:Uncharacterized protein n=1 Tax=Eretmocerus hayati TaxID=131215 RepID=A0ACC2PGX2_9HYME|nr:hypothetical protein QAD02_018100 [Eretmocerus hayati]
MILTYFAAYLGTLVLLSMMMLSIAPILEVISPLEDDTGETFYFLQADYIFFEGQDHPFIYSLHCSAVLTIGCITCASLFSPLVITMSQICGLFFVTSCRLNDFVISLENIGRNGHSKAYHNKKEELARVVDLHEQTIKLCGLLDQTFYLMIGEAELIAVIGLACGYTSVLDENMILTKRCFNVVMTVGVYIYLLTINALGQKIIDSSEEVFDSM